MYRYSVDNAVTYTPSDFILFRESPFAVWMERLNLENPEHGSVPDKDCPPPKDEAQPQDEIVDSLRDEDRDVVLIGWDQDESRRRADTLDAMRSGADFIVNGMLALGPLAGSANLLMRTSGYSDFGDFLYVPCDTQGTDTLDAAFRLCFLSDLLHSMQGQLPPQMLLIREDANVLPLQTEEHIYYYRAVKKRFMDAMSDFRKHRMPDPAESMHFGRWSECAREALKRRSVNPEYQLQELTEAEEESQFDVAQPVARAVGAAGLDVATSGAVAGSVSSTVNASKPGATSAPTLAEQARMLSQDAFRPKAAPGQTPNLARFPRLVTDSTSSESTPADSTLTELTPTELKNSAQAAPSEARTRGFADETLRDLAFIGSSEPAPLYDSPASPSIIPASESPGQDIKLDLESDVAEALVEGSIDRFESALDPITVDSAADNAGDSAKGGIEISVEGAGEDATESPRLENTLVETKHSNDESAESNKGYFGQDIDPAFEPSAESLLEEHVGEESGTLLEGDVEEGLGDGSEGKFENGFEDRREDHREDKVGDSFEKKVENSVEEKVEDSFEEKVAAEFADKLARARDAYALSSVDGQSLANDGSAVSPEDAPAPNLRGKAALSVGQEPEPQIEGYEVEIIALEAFDMELREPLLLPPDPVSSQQGDRADGSSEDSANSGDSLVDLDSAPPPALTPVSVPKTLAASEHETDYFGQEKSAPSEALQDRVPRETAARESARREDSLTTPALEQPSRETSGEQPGHEESALTPRDNAGDTVGDALRNFSSSLITNEDYEDHS